VGLTTPHRKKPLCYENKQRREMAKNCLHTNIIHRNRSLIEQGRYIATAV
jgi:hypothetical protein